MDYHYCIHIISVGMVSKRGEWVNISIYKSLPILRGDVLTGSYAYAYPYCTCLDGTESKPKATRTAVT